MDIFLDIPKLATFPSKMATFPSLSIYGNSHIFVVATLYMTNDTDAIVFEYSGHIVLLIMVTCILLCVYIRKVSLDGNVA